MITRGKKKKDISKLWLSCRVCTALMIVIYILLVTFVPKVIRSSELPDDLTELDIEDLINGDVISWKINF